MNLVIGASGQVGHHLMKALSHGDKPGAVGTYYQHPMEGLEHLDITEPNSVWRMIKAVHPDVIYLAAGNVNADYCEEHISETDLVNIQGIENVLHSICLHNLLSVIQPGKIDIKLVFFSSDYLFDGATGLYSEIVEPHPLNVYGRQKQIAEMLIRNAGIDSLIIRTCGIFSWEPQGKNFAQRLVKSLRSEQSVRVPSGRWGTPTYAPDLVQATVELVNRGATGVYNVAGHGWVSRPDFAWHIADVFRFDQSLIIDSSPASLGQKAIRPLYGGLAIDKVRGFLGYFPQNYLSGIERMAQSEAIPT